MKTIYEFLLKSKTSVSTQDNDCVDLGLPSGLLWATCNIGADKPTDYGDYFMWGSTKPDTDNECRLKTCPFNTNKVNDIDIHDACRNDILVPEYDAATVILGSEWRLPTNDDFEELIDNTEHKWIRNYQGSKVNGMRFTPKNAEANGAELDTELFIPASGYRIGSIFRWRGGQAYLWSASFNTENTINESNIILNKSTCVISYNYRSTGLCLRGVKEK